MRPKTFDPSEFVRGLQQLLISDKKRIAFLFGAGTSVAKKNINSPTVPAVNQMTKEIITALKTSNPEYQTSLTEIEAELGAKFNIEVILSGLEQKAEVVGLGTLNGLTKVQICNLIENLKRQIRDKVSAHKGIAESENYGDLVQADFAEWVGNIERKYPIEIFTTNYDLLLEIGLEHHRVPYFTGFSGSYEPFFASELVEDVSYCANHTKLWKIHGSLGWHHNKRTGAVIRKSPTDQDILIYPSNLKYNQSQKQPYTSLMDRLSSFLRRDDGILFTCGYSFNDEHINERILSSLKTNTSSHVIALFHDKYWNTPTSSYQHSLTEDSPAAIFGKKSHKLSIYGQRSAVIGRVFGNWKLRKEPSPDETIALNLYFDEDAPNPQELAVGQTTSLDGCWSGDGSFTVTDFKNFIVFLNSMIVKASGENL